MPSWIFSSYKDHKSSRRAKALGQASPGVQLLTLVPYYSKLTCSFLALIISAEASYISFCASHCFKHLYRLSCIDLATDLMAKLTLNYPHYQKGKLQNRESSLSLATQTRKLLSQNLILVSGFRVHIYSLCYAGDGNIGM